MHHFVLGYLRLQHSRTSDMLKVYIQYVCVLSVHCVITLCPFVYLGLKTQHIIRMLLHKVNIENEQVQLLPT